jgi:hypothetical protein
LGKSEGSIDNSRRIEIIAPTGGVSFIDFTKPNTDFCGRILYDTSAHFMSFFVTQNEKMRITAFGNVGIGTTAPSEKFTIATGNLSVVSGNLHTNRGRLCFSDVPIDRNHSMYNNYKNIDGEGSWDGLKMNVYRGLDVRTGQANAGSTPNSVLFVNDSGNVGIGTTTPAARLEVSGNISLGNFNVRTNRFIGLPVDATWNHNGGYIRFGSFQDNGGYSNDIGFITQRYTTGGQESMTISTNGNVGIGTTAPAALLQVGTDADFTRLPLRVGGGTYGANVVMSVAPGTVFFDRPGLSGAAFSILGTNGSVGIGTSAPNAPLHVYGNNYALFGPNTAWLANLRIGGNGSSPSDADASIAVTNGNLHIDAKGTFYTYLNYYRGTGVIFGTGAAGTAGIWKADGSVGINTDNPGIYKLYVNGNAANTTGVWANVSDKRLKKEIKPLNNSLDTILKLQGVSFHWKDAKKDKEAGLQRGFIAQEVEKVIPEWVKTDDKGYKTLEKIGVEAILVEAIKELKQQNDAKVKALDEELKALKAEIRKNR